MRSRFADKLRKQTEAIEQQLQLVGEQLIETVSDEEPTHEVDRQLYGDRHNYTPEFE